MPHNFKHTHSCTLLAVQVGGAHHLGPGRPPLALRLARSSPNYSKQQQCAKPECTLETSYCVKLCMLHSPPADRQLWAQLPAHGAHVGAARRRMGWPPRSSPAATAAMPAAETTARCHPQSCAEVDCGSPPCAEGPREGTAGGEVSSLLIIAHSYEAY